MTVLAGLLLGVAVALVLRPPVSTPLPRDVRAARQVERADWLVRWRWCWSLLAGAGAALFVGGSVALPAGALAATGVWVWAGRAEPASVRRWRTAVERDLPAVVQLLAVALECGCDVPDALRIVSSALPGPSARLLDAVHAGLSLGVAPAEAWRPALQTPGLAPLGRAMVRAQRSGASVTHEVSRLADDLERRAHQRVEERARAVGVRAALPLCLCLLPAFLLVGVVPLVVSLLCSLRL